MKGGEEKVVTFFWAREDGEIQAQELKVPAAGGERASQTMVAITRKVEQLEKMRSAAEAPTEPYTDDEEDDPSSAKSRERSQHDD